MKLTNKQYNTLKWIVITVMPALSVLIGTVGGSLEWEYTSITTTILNAVTVFLGTSIGVSSINHAKSN